MEAHSCAVGPQELPQLCNLHPERFLLQKLLCLVRHMHAESLPPIFETVSSAFFEAQHAMRMHLSCRQGSTLTLLSMYAYAPGQLCMLGISESLTFGLWPGGREGGGGGV